jgi:hypothetical protein
MRDTLKSFTGGEIITVKEAAKSPELRTQFYMQEQLLKSMYGISGPAADRTADLLKNLDQALAGGDQDLAAETQAELTEFIKKQTDTKSVGEILDVQFSKFLRSFEDANKTLLEQSRATNLELLSFSTKLASGDSEQMRGALEQIDATLKGMFGADYLTKVRESVSEAGEDIASTAGNIYDSGKAGVTLTLDTLDAINQRLNVASTTLSAAATAITTITGGLKMASSVLPGTHSSSP